MSATVIDRVFTARAPRARLHGNASARLARIAAAAMSAVLVVVQRPGEGFLPGHAAHHDHIGPDRSDDARSGIARICSDPVVRARSACCNAEGCRGASAIRVGKSAGCARSQAALREPGRRSRRRHARAVRAVPRRRAQAMGCGHEGGGNSRRVLARFRSSRADRFVFYR